MRVTAGVGAHGRLRVPGALERAHRGGAPTAITRCPAALVACTASTTSWPARGSAPCASRARSGRPPSTRRNVSMPTSSSTAVTARRPCPRSACMSSGVKCSPAVGAAARMRLGHRVDRLVLLGIALVLGDVGRQRHMALPRGSPRRACATRPLRGRRPAARSAPAGRRGCPRRKSANLGLSARPRQRSRARAAPPARYSIDGAGLAEALPGLHRGRPIRGPRGRRSSQRLSRSVSGHAAGLRARAPSRRAGITRVLLMTSRSPGSM